MCMTVRNTKMEMSLALLWFIPVSLAHLILRAHSSVGQSRRLIISWSGVQVPLSPPFLKVSRNRLAFFLIGRPKCYIDGRVTRYSLTD